MNKIAAFFDCPYWATWINAEGLRKYGPPSYQVDTFQIGHLEDSKLRQYDAVYHLYLLGARRSTHIRRLAACVASHAWCYQYNTPTDWRTRGVNKSRNSTTGRAVVGQLDVAVCRSNEIQAWCSKYAKKSATIPAGVDLDLWRTKPRPIRTKLKVGWCGQIAGEPKKDFKGYNEIMEPLMLRLGDRFEWQCNGRDWSQRLSVEEMTDWYADLDIFLTTSPADGTPNCPFQAVAAGCCMLSTDIGQVADWDDARKLGVIGPTFWSPETAATTIDWFSEQLIALDEDRPRIQQIATELRGSVEANYDYRIIAPRILDFICEGL